MKITINKKYFITVTEVPLYLKDFPSIIYTGLNNYPINMDKLNLGHRVKNNTYIYTYITFNDYIQLTTQDILDYYAFWGEDKAKQYTFPLETSNHFIKILIEISIILHNALIIDIKLLKKTELSIFQINQMFKYINIGNIYKLCIGERYDDTYSMIYPEPKTTTIKEEQNKYILYSTTPTGMAKKNMKKFDYKLLYLNYLPRKKLKKKKIE